MNARESFLANRLTGLGGSDIGAIFNLSKFSTPYEVWLEKTGRAEPKAETLQMRFGTTAEQFVADEYTRMTGRKVQRFTPMLRHPTAPIIGHVDRLVIPEGAARASHQKQIRTDTGLECKTVNAFSFSNSIEWGPDGSDEVPLSYYMQCATYMALTGCEYWDLAALIGNHDFRVYHLKRDLDLEAQLIERATEWWDRHVVHDIPPEPQSEAEARQMWASHKAGKTISVPASLAEQIRQYERIKADIKALEEQAQALRDAFIPALEDADTIYGPDGNVIATYRQNKPSQKTNWKAAVDQIKGWLIEQQIDGGVEAVRDIIDSNTSETPGARVLRIAGNNKE